MLTDDRCVWTGSYLVEHCTNGDMLQRTTGFIWENSFYDENPEGKPGMSDVSSLSGISGLSFDSTLLSPLSFFRLVLLLFLSYLFSAC